MYRKIVLRLCVLGRDRPEEFKPGLATLEGQSFVTKACGDAVVAKLNRPNFDHYSFFMPREVDGAAHYKPQQEANLWRGQFRLTDRRMPVARYDIEANGTAFYKNSSLDLTGVFGDLPLQSDVRGQRHQNKRK